MGTYKGLNEFNVAPSNAKKIGVFKDNSLVGYVPLGNLNKNRGTLLYKVGLLSDIHQDVTNDETESENDLANALSLYKSLGVDFCISAGDIILEATIPNKQPEYQNFGKVVSAQDLKVYSCTGNHDVWVYSESDWKKYVNAKNQVRYSDVNYVSGGTNSSFEITKGNDHYLFLSMQNWIPSDSETYNALERAYSAEELAWLTNKLEEYRNERTFVITHLFFPDGAGNFYKGDAHYATNNLLAGNAYNTLKNLRSKYPNTVWFSGHSHWKYYLQEINSSEESYKGKYCNVCRAAEGAWMVHLSSIARPIDAKLESGVWKQDKDNSCYGMASEGGIMYVYENAIEIQGISLKTNNHGNTGNTTWDNTFLPIGDYLLDTTLVNVEASTPETGGTEEPEPEEPTVINGIELTSDEVENWKDVTDLVVGTSSAVTVNGSSDTQPANVKVGLINSAGKYTLKSGINHLVRSKDYLSSLNSITNNTTVKGGISTFAEMITSSSFTTDGLGASSQKIRVIFKGLHIWKADDTSAKFDVSVSDFYYNGGSNVAYTNGAKPKSRTDGSIQVDFYGANNKFIIWNKAVFGEAVGTIVSPKVDYYAKFDSVVVLVQK